MAPSGGLTNGNLSTRSAAAGPLWAAVHSDGLMKELDYDAHADEKLFHELLLIGTAAEAAYNIEAYEEEMREESNVRDSDGSFDRRTDYTAADGGGRGGGSNQGSFGGILGRLSSPFKSRNSRASRASRVSYASSGERDARIDQAIMNVKGLTSITDAGELRALSTAGSITHAALSYSMDHGRAGASMVSA
mmetsp:Transcript_45220/g.124246  ORF Transcript_45220/g.124246 Transcript_45220/m.124246 type:complete len:191 (+) Transcript_45220:553-1125(+)